jgi:hypothetical protein
VNKQDTEVKRSKAILKFNSIASFYLRGEGRGGEGGRRGEGRRERRERVENVCHLFFLYYYNYIVISLF